MMNFSRQEEVTGKLKGLLAGQCRIEAELRAVTPLFPRLQSLKGDSERLREMIAFTAGLAEGVSAKVMRTLKEKSNF